MPFEFVYNENPGLGDCLSCFNTELPIWSPSPHFSTLRKYSSLKTRDHCPNGVGLNVTSLHDKDYDNAHLFNRVRVATGLAPIDPPGAILDLVNYTPDKKNIAFSFDVGKFALYQTNFHPRPRQLYAEHRATVQKFITDNSNNFNFIEVGAVSTGFTNVVNMTGIGLEKTIDVLLGCNHYFGMHSGMMHLATAIGVRCTIVINFPTMEKLTTAPEQFNPNDKLEWEKQWLYPQHTYLHEDEVDTVNSITKNNLITILE